ncbi:MAG: hypothetical protein GY756_14640, partial [bacterium]|nr:hypothetical protein [bacterium]
PWLLNLNESQYAKKIMDSKISVKLTKEYDKKILNLKARGLATMSQVLFSHEKYNNALRQFRDSVKDYKNVKNEIKLEIELIELHIKSLDINLPEKSKIKVAVGSHIAKGQTVAIFYKSYHI